MTATTIRSVGLCAHYSPQGDWAFDLAFRIAREHALQLNIFHFLHDPYGPEERTTRGLSGSERARSMVEQEKELRLRYDERLGDYLQVGFRLCEDRAWVELHRCLCRREFELLVLPWPEQHSTFGGEPVEWFIDRFVCPMVTVGPTSPKDLHVNSPAHLILPRLEPDLVTAAAWVHSRAAAI
jgi:hypothetical protein